MEEQQALLVGQPVNSLNRFSWFNPPGRRIDVVDGSGGEMPKGIASYEDAAVQMFYIFNMLFRFAVKGYWCRKSRPNCGHYYPCKNLGEGWVQCLSESNTFLPLIMLPQGRRGILKINFCPNPRWRTASTFSTFNCHNSAAALFGFAQICFRALWIRRGCTRIEIHLS